MRANKGKVIDDPFTRRSTRPKMFSQKEDDSSKDDIDKASLPTEHILKPTIIEKESVPESKKKQNTDLFNAHNFDITIDLEVPMTSKCTSFKKATLLLLPEFFVENFN